VVKNAEDSNETIVIGEMAATPHEPTYWMLNVRKRVIGS
jgi:hypothetical protein